MKLIKQSFEILEQRDFNLVGIKRFIERCGRVCYKSEDRITDDSYEKFVDMLIKRDHTRPLEFGTIHLKMSVSDFHKLRDTLCINKMWNNQWIRYVCNGDLTYITTNYRYFLDIVKILPFVEDCIDPSNTKLKNKYYKRHTVHFILSRGIMDEFRTHIGLSHLAESTRYCNYSKDKFDNELTFIIPSWLDTPEGHYAWETMFGDNMYIDTSSPIKEQYNATLFIAEKNYLDFIRQGWTPQQAREVLPLSVKSELISCGFEDAWSNFFYRRCAKDAHPMAREIAIPLQEKFKELSYVNQ